MTGRGADSTKTSPREVSLLGLAGLLSEEEAEAAKESIEATREEDIRRNQSMDGAQGDSDGK